MKKVVNKRWQERKPTVGDNMLMQFLRATTPKEKRDVIKSFAPHYFIFGETLDPRNPYDTDNTTERNEDVSK